MNGTSPFGVSLAPVSSPSPPHAVSEGEWPALRTALNAVFRPAGGDLTMEYPLLFGPTNRCNLRVICSTSGGTEILAHAGFVTRDALILRRKARVACIGAVATAAPHRGRGLGSRVFVEALRAARRGADLVMVSGNRGLYRRQGLDPVPPLAHFRLPPAAEAAKPLETRQADVADLKSLAALYDGEDVHFVRSAEDWGLLWTAGRLLDAPARFWVVARAGRDVAYTVVQQPGPAPDGSARPRRILEVAGDRQAVVQAAPGVADELLVPAYDSATAQLCEDRGWPRATRDFLLTAEALTPEVPVIPWYGLNYV